MIHMHAIFDSVASRTKMQNGSSKAGRGVTVNGLESTLQRQQRPKSALNRQDRGSCSSTASCPVFSPCRRDPGEDLPPRCPSSLSSPTLQGSHTSQHGTIPIHKKLTANLKSSISSLHGSLSSLQSSVSNLKSFPTSSALQSSNQSLHSSTTSFCSSSTSFRSSSSSVQSGSSSEDESWDTNSWSSGATCLLRSSIKQHSEEVFRVRASSDSRPEPASDSEAGYQNSESCQGSERQHESQQTKEKALLTRKDSVHSQISSQCSAVASATSADLEKIEAKLKFSKFLDEVTCRVLDPESLQAFGAVQQKVTPVSIPELSLVNCSHPLPVTTQHLVHPDAWFDSNEDSLHSNKEPSKVALSVYNWNKCVPTCKFLDYPEAQRRTHEERPFMESPRKTYLETDIDRVRIEDELGSAGAEDTQQENSREGETERITLLFSSSRSQKNSDSKKCSSAVSDWSEDSAKTPYCSTSLCRLSNSNLAPNGESHAMSSVQEQKESLQKCLNYTTQKLEMLECEFDSTRQYLEMELQRAQEELEKFTEKLHRLRSSYSALQRINQDLEDKIHKITQQYEEEKRALSREIIILSNHLMEAKITIEKLKEDNDLYRKDCNLAAQLLQRGQYHYNSHKLSELPTDFQERVSSHIQKHGHARSTSMCHSSYSDVVPAAIIAKVLQKPEPGSSYPATCLSSPQSQDDGLLQNNEKDTVDTLYCSVNKSSDLYCSDTALYCRMDERGPDRWQELPQSIDLHGREGGLLQAWNSNDSKPEEDDFHSSFSHKNIPFHEQAARSLPGSSSYSSLSLASDEKRLDPSRNISSSHVPVYMDWKEGDFDSKRKFSFYKDSTGFPKPHGFQYMPKGSQKVNTPTSAQTSSSYTSSPSLGGSGTPKDSSSSMDIPVEQMTGCWRQLSVEDINTFSYHSSGCVSSYGCPDQHLKPVKSKLRSLYNSQEECDLFQTHMIDACLPNSHTSPALSSKHCVGLYKTEKRPIFNLKDNIKESKTRLFLHRSAKDKKNKVGNVNKEYTDLYPNNSDQSLNSSNVQNYQLQSPGSQRKTTAAPPPQYQKITTVTTGLSRKDSLTKAQLYGTLLN